MATNPGTENECLTFGDLKHGQRFIAKPIPGDNDGHGGFAGVHYIHMKIKPPVHNRRDSEKPNNAVNNQGILKHFSDDMEVIPVE